MASLFSKTPSLFYISTTIYEGSDLHISLTPIFCSHPRRYKVIYHYGSDLHFLMANDVGHVFYGHLFFMSNVFILFSYL